MYKLCTFIDINNIKQNGVQRLSDMAQIPPDESNLHYQEYLNWLAEGNTPEEPENGN